MAPRLRPSGPRAWVTIAVGVVVVWLLFELIVLRGEVVHRATMPLGSTTTFQAETVGETYVVEVASTVRSSSRKSAMQHRFHVVVADSAGDVVLDQAKSFRSRSSAFFQVVPITPGPYAITVTDEKLGGGYGSARVTVYRNDRRLLTRLLF